MPWHCDRTLLPRALSTTMAVMSEAEIIAWLESGAPFTGEGGGPVEPVRRIDTHAASVFLAGDRAWKLKRPVSLGYLDFSTVERRHAALETELRLNRRSAPALYLGLHRISCAPDGALALDGAGETVDWLLEMRRFPDGALLEDRVASEGLDDATVVALADHVAAIHAGADLCRVTDGAARLRKVADDNGAVMARYPDWLDAGKVGTLRARIDQLIDRQAPLLDARGREGRIRHCHGDLHLGNIALVDGKPLAFDRLEFDTALATIDLLYDFAFLLMDLWEHGLFRQANMLFNRYLDLSPEDENAIALLPLFMAMRASIRAHVLATQAEQEGGKGSTDAALVGHARHYLDLALHLVEPVPARLIAVGGLSGTGKSTLARLIGGDVGAAPGARILRSDVLRKRLAGVAPETRLDPAAYTREKSHAVYAEIDRLAGVALRSGRAVIADAMFAAGEERTAIRTVADAADCRFDGIWLTLAEDERIARVEARVADASDADAGVVRVQTARHADVPADWLMIETEGDMRALAARIEAILGFGQA
ncbi:MAG: AAA family ATPase [Sphingobium sp.]